MSKVVQVAASLVMLRGNRVMLLLERLSTLRGRSQRASGIEECPQLSALSSSSSRQFVAMAWRAASEMFVQDE